MTVNYGKCFTTPGLTEALVHLKIKTVAGWEFATLIVSASGGDDQDRPESLRRAAISEPTPVIWDHPAESTASRAFAALVSPMPEPAECKPLEARSEKKRPGELTKEAIRRIADRAEQSSAAKKR